MPGFDMCGFDCGDVVGKRPVATTLEDGPDDHQCTNGNRQHVRGMLVGVEGFLMKRCQVDSKEADEATPGLAMRS